ncbi:MAG: hypothetical protein CVU57_22355 [Deltaproteobacteria bacterium HGW-Deltaproteobacteria-15]|nr:MAG: hypothetical protein CVU57_22355 [Deltaproteobacteria bacterium HGW-Deltaproteobacteria-15]
MRRGSPIGIGTGFQKPNPKARGDEQEPDMRCGTSGASGHVTAKPSIGNEGIWGRPSHLQFFRGHNNECKNVKGVPPNFLNSIKSPKPTREPAAVTGNHGGRVA